MYIIDTHILLWWLEDPAQLSEEAQAIIGNPDNIIWVSVASIWEISIKVKLGKLEIPDNLLEMIKENNFRVLEIKAEHAQRSGQLPDHHKDPFDHLLMAQALEEGLTLISRDAKFTNYDVPLIIG